MRSLLVIVFLFLSVPVFAQSDGGSQDSSGAGALRPRSGSYVVGCFPSPAFLSEPITIQTYNRNPTELSVTIYDNAGREVLDLIPKQTMPGGLQTMTIPPFGYPPACITFGCSRTRRRIPRQPSMSSMTGVLLFFIDVFPIDARNNSNASSGGL